jgi:hypothetical protein
VSRMCHSACRACRVVSCRAVCSRTALYYRRRRHSRQL